MCNSIFNHAPDVDVSVIREFRGEYLLMIAVVPQVTTLPPGELKGWTEGIVDQAGYFCCLVPWVLAYRQLLQISYQMESENNYGIRHPKLKIMK